MSGRSYSSAGRGSRGLAVGRRGRGGQQQARLTKDAEIKENKISAQFLKAPKMVVPKSISDVLNAMKATIRMDFNPQGAGSCVIIPNSAIPGAAGLEMPTLEDISRVGAMSQFVQTAKKNDVSLETRHQVFADSYRVAKSLEDGKDSKYKMVPIDSNGLAQIKMWCDLLEILNQNRLTAMKNQCPDTPKAVRDYIVRDCIRIRNSIFKHLCRIVQASVTKEDSPRKNARELGVCDFMYSLLSKKITIQTNISLSQLLFPKNDWLKGFSFTVDEIRNTSICSDYFQLLGQSTMMLSAFRNDELLKAVCFIPDTINLGTDESMTKVNSQAVVLIPPYTKLSDVAQLIADRKIGSYAAKWSPQVDLLNAVRGPKVLNHMFLKLKLCLPRSGDIEEFYEDFFSSGDKLRERYRTKGFNDNDNIGHWLLKTFPTEGSVPNTYTDMFDIGTEIGWANTLTSYFLADLGFGDESRIGKALLNFCELEEREGEKGYVFKILSSVKKTRKIPDPKDPSKEAVEVYDEVLLSYPDHKIYRKNEAVDETIALLSKEDMPHSLGIGKESKASKDSPEGRWRAEVFREVLEKASDGSKQLGAFMALSKLDREAKVLLSRVSKSNAGLARSLADYLAGFSNRTVQRYAVSVLDARFDQLVTEMDFSLPSDDDDPDDVSKMSVPELDFGENESL